MAAAREVLDFINLRWWNGESVAEISKLNVEVRGLRAKTGGKGITLPLVIRKCTRF